MKSNFGSSLVKRLKQKGWVELNGVLKHRNKLLQQEEDLLLINSIKRKQRRSVCLKTGWIDDSRNIKNKAIQQDLFIQMIQQELGLEVWPEFYFSVERLFRIDYAIPYSKNGKLLKVAIEQEGGIWAKGNSGHSSGKGIKRDMEKNNLLQSSGWKLIRKEPSELFSLDTLDLLRKLSQ